MGTVSTQKLPASLLIFQFQTCTTHWQTQKRYIYIYIQILNRKIEENLTVYKFKLSIAYRWNDSLASKSRHLLDLEFQFASSRLYRPLLDVHLYINGKRKRPLFIQFFGRFRSMFLLAFCIFTWECQECKCIARKARIRSEQAHEKRPMENKKKIANLICWTV